jgi:hypothetical protein
MNCKQAEELLPLYAGGDLEERRARFLTAHVQTCAACGRVADEYRESIQLTEQFAPQVFSEAVYAGIRQRVLSEIETKAKAPAWSQTIASLFRPRPSWAIAGVLLIVVSMIAIYFIVNRGSDEQQLADKLPAKVQPGTKEHLNSGRHDNRRADLPSSTNTDGKKQPLAGVPQPRRKRSSTANNVSPQPRSLPEPMMSPHRDSSALVKTLRVEIQTKDPKIRIIWFVQPETKPVIPSSKGI